MSLLAGHDQKTAAPTRKATRREAQSNGSSREPKSNALTCAPGSPPEAKFAVLPLWPDTVNSFYADRACSIRPDPTRKTRDYAHRWIQRLHPDKAINVIQHRRPCQAHYMTLELMVVPERSPE